MTPQDHSTEFDGHIDLGKQLSILHTLLLECVEKISPVRLQEVDKLHTILERIRLALAQPAGVRTPLHCIENQPPNDQNNVHQPVQHQNIFRYVGLLLLFVEQPMLSKNHKNTIRALIIIIVEFI